MKRVLWLISDKLGCGSYRCYIPALSLQETNQVDSDFMLTDKWEAPHSYNELEEKDFLILQRAIEPQFIKTVKEAKIRGIKTAFEFDDDLFNVPPHNPASFYWRQKNTQKNFRKILDEVDKIIVSTRPLKIVTDKLIGTEGTDKVILGKNHLHRGVWGHEKYSDVRKFNNRGRTVIGWQGSTTHNEDFKQALPALAKILEERPNVVLRLFGAVPPCIKGVIPDVRFEWTEGVPFERYPAKLMFVNYDIGIAPIVSSQFNLCKSNIKWMEYAAFNIPCVASNVYPYAQSIKHGITGFLARNPDEWYSSLTSLLDSVDLRNQIAANANKDVWDTWDSKHQIKPWLDFLGIENGKLSDSELNGTSRAGQLGDGSITTVAGT